MLPPKHCIYILSILKMDANQRKPQKWYEMKSF